MKRKIKLCAIALCALLISAACVFAASADDGTSTVATDSIFEYTTSGNVTKYTDDFATAVSGAGTGTTVYMNADYVIESSKNGPIATVNKKLTLDMQGHSFTIRDKYESSTNNGQSSIYVSTTSGFTVKNGTLISGYCTSAEKNRDYTFFHYGINNAVLNLENVSTYLGTVVYSWGSHGVKLNITGGEHHSMFSQYGNDGGYINGRAGMTVTATDAKFYISNNSWLLASYHQNDKSGAPKSTFTFTNCDIITASADRNLVYANEYTTIAFNGCSFFGGKIIPAISTGETDKGIGVMADGAIVLGQGTAWHSGFEYDARTVIASGYLLSKKTVTESITLSKHTGNNYDGYTIAAPKAENYTTEYMVIDPADAPKVTVNWCDSDGKVLATTLAPENATATPPTLDSYREESNGWYIQVYDGWSTTPGGDPDKNLIATEGAKFYVTRGSVKADFRPTKYNLKLMGHVQINLFVPEFMPAGVSIVGVYRTAANAESDTSAVAKGDVSISADGAYAEYVVGWSGATNLHESKSIFLKYAVTHDGTTSTLVQEIKLSALGYLKVLLADSKSEKPAYPPAAYKMVANIVRYSYVLSETIGSTPNEEIAALYNEYVPALLSEIDNTTDSDFPESGQTVGALADYIYSIAFEVGSYQPRFRIVFKENSGVTDMKIGFEGWFAGGEGEPNWKEQTFSYNRNSGILYYDSRGQYVNTSGKVCDETGKVLSGKTAGTVTSNIAVLYSDNIQIYNIGMDMTVTLTTSGGTVSGKYGINAYYNGIKETLDGGTLASVRKFLKVMRAYGDSVVAYRFVNGRDPVGGAVERIVKYKDFGAVGDGVANDYEAIRRAHEYANKVGCKVAADSGATYYIGLTGGKTVQIKTDTDWTGATFVIDDTCFDVTNTTERNTAIFNIASDTARKTYNASGTDSVAAALKAINAAGGIDKDNFDKLDLGLGYAALVYLINANHNCYIRYGENADSGSAQRELVLIDENGNVDESTPLLFDYSEVTSVEVVRIDDAPITVKGGTFITKANAAPRQYTYYARNINVTRSNATLTGFDHQITGEGDTGAPYNGFFTFSYCNNSTLNDSVLSAHKAYKLQGVDNNTMGTYDLSFGNANKITCTGVTMHNFFSRGSTVSVYDGYWGVMGSNYCKNLAYESCKLTRFDAHCGTYNATIRNSDIGTLTLIGGGKFLIENSKVYTGSNLSMITLRGDYGSTWNGEFVIKDVTAVTTSITATTFSLMNGSFTNHNFGYACYMPEKVTVDNFKVEGGSWLSGIKTVNLATGSIATTAGISGATVDGGANANPYTVTKTLVVKNNNAGYTYKLPTTSDYASSVIIKE